MIPTIFFYTIGLFITSIALILPDVQLWPEVVFESLEYFVINLMELNVLFIVIPDIFDALQFFIRFLMWFTIFLLIRKVFNFARGTGQGL